MKWILTVFIFIVPSASAESEGVSDNLRGLRRSADHAEKKKQRKKKDRSDAEAHGYNISSPSIETASSTIDTTAAADDPTSTISSSASSPSTTVTSHVENSEINETIPQEVTRVRALSRSGKQTLLVNHVYTYGAPSVVKGPAMSNPDNGCIPGLRIYAEDFKQKTCSWWKPWCTPGGTEITDVDFAAQINVKEGYPHPKMATLVLRLEEGSSKASYTYRACRDYEGKNEYPHQSWPAANLDSDILPGWNVHDLDEHYEKRLLQVPYTIRGPSLEYVSAAKCAYESSDRDLRNCLNNYNQQTSSRIGGVARSGWRTLAYMTHTSESKTGMPFLSDTDTVYVLKKDQSADYRKCIIAFQGSDGASDLTRFLMRSNDPAAYCGRHGVHSGVKDELWKITHDAQYANVIVPALETCHEVTCVGHSLGGALCNAFTMCANQGSENLDGLDNGHMWDDYNSLIWQPLSLN